MAGGVQPICASFCAFARVCVSLLAGRSQDFKRAAVGRSPDFQKAAKCIVCLFSMDASKTSKELRTEDQKGTLF